LAGFATVYPQENSSLFSNKPVNPPFSMPMTNFWVPPMKPKDYLESPFSTKSKIDMGAIQTD
jgi:hypothetical protein